MSFLTNLDFVHRHLQVAYRASDAPQRVHLHIALERPVEDAILPVIVEGFVDQVNLGGAGGAEFPARAGRAAIVSGPTDLDDPVALSGVCTWELAVTAVSPFFLRNMVEAMAGASAETKVGSMSIVGALPVDDSPLSVRETDLRTWLTDTASYLQQTPSPGFPVSLVESPRGITVRARLEEDLTDELYEHLILLLTTWRNIIHEYPDSTGTRLGAMQPDQHCGRTKRELRAGKVYFDHKMAPARAVLVNLFSRFHHTLAPLSELELGMK